MRLQREDELQCAVGISARGGNIEAEDRFNVIGCEYTIELRSERLVGLRSGDLSDVMREFELTGCEFTRTSFSGLQRALLQDFSRKRGGEASKNGNGGNGFHRGWYYQRKC